MGCGLPTRSSRRALYDNGRTPFDGSTAHCGCHQAGCTPWTRRHERAARRAGAGDSRQRPRDAGPGAALLARRPPGSYDLDYRYTERDGTALIVGSFLNQASELAQPIHDETHSLDAGISYRADNWQARLGYVGSFFANTTTTLRWQNPYTPVDGRCRRRRTGAGAGQRVSPAHPVRPVPLVAADPAQRQPGCRPHDPGRGAAGLHAESRSRRRAATRPTPTPRWTRCTPTCA